MGELDQDKKIVSVKDANLRNPDPQVGDRIEVFGLESESGSKLNGRQGTIVEYIAEKERFKIEMAAGEFVSIKPSNLRRISLPVPSTNTGEGEKQEQHEKQADDSGSS